jgi:hypothetical protein
MMRAVESAISWVFRKKWRHKWVGSTAFATSLLGLFSLWVGHKRVIYVVEKVFEKWGTIDPSPPSSSFYFALFPILLQFFYKKT